MIHFGKKSFWGIKVGMGVLKVWRNYFKLISGTFQMVVAAKFKRHVITFTDDLERNASYLMNTFRAQITIKN